MTEKDTVSMATVQMKPDYAASEVYSTASEAPPAYKRQANSVKIAKITAFTIIVSSFVLGSFILASSYLQAKASCDQVQALDSVLEKELMLETLQQVSKELPRAEALMGKDNTDEVDLQNLDTKETAHKTVTKPEVESIDNSYSENEIPEELRHLAGKLPLELDLSDLAAALLQKNKKSRMNCVVERKHAEEIVDSPSKTVALPFGMNLTTDPKKARITGERISIFCEGGDENKEREESPRNNREEDDESDEDAEQLRPMFIPYQRVPIPFGPIPQQYPLTHMPQRMLPLPMQTHHHQAGPQQQQQQQELPIIRQLPPPFQHLPMRPPMPPQVMQAPRQEPQTVRIHVQQIPFREIRVSDEMPMSMMSRPQQPQQQQQQQQQQEMPQFQVQRVPLRLALQHAGITADDLHNIQMMAENRITEELRRLAAEEAANESSENNSSNSNSSEEDDSSDSQNNSSNSEQTEQTLSQSEQPQQHEMPQARMMQMQQGPPQRLILQQLPEQPRDTMTPPMDQPAAMQFGRAAFGRSLAQPVRIPVPMMPAQADMSQDSSSSAAASAESERPHFVQPRSV